MKTSTLLRGTEAVRRARSQVGKGYDFLGIVGAPDKNRRYCSELAAWSMGVPVDKLGAWNVLHPKDLHSKGTLVFDSGSRDGVPDQVPTTASAPESAPAPEPAPAAPAEAPPASAPSTAPSATPSGNDAP